MPTLAANLVRARAAILSRFPGTTIYWIGDEAHQAEPSDHNPDSRGIVHALDVMAVAGTSAAIAVVRAAVGRPDLQYVIHNRKIWSRSWGWTTREYTGRDSHTDHVHMSGKHGSVGGTSRTESGYDVAAESDTTPWNLGGSPMADTDIPETFRTARNGDKWGFDIVTGAQPARFLGSDSVEHTTPNVLHQKLDAILANTAADLAEDRAATAALKVLTDLVRTGGGNVDVAPVLAAIDSARAATLAEVQSILTRLRAAADAESTALGE